MTPDELIKQKASNIASALDPNPEVPKFVLTLTLVILEIIYYSYTLYKACKKPADDNPPDFESIGLFGRMLIIRKARNQLRDNNLDIDLAPKLVNQMLIELSKTSKEEFKLMGNL